VKRAFLGILAFAAFVFVRPAGSADLSGWLDARWGMTPDQVQKVLNYPTSVADLASVCGAKCDEGAALQLDDYDLSDQHFMVRFWFTKPDMRLHTVSMYTKARSDDSDNGSFSKIKDFLQTVYGSPQSVGLDRGHFVATWTLPSTTITLYSNATDQVAVVYEEKPVKKAEDHKQPGDNFDKTRPHSAETQ
jgi:hypothetical protein